ncbi:hypothetical protein [Acinetobacter baumannii]|uniref:hypothetical protein n=1 Tax=Acinetobacter baumannii TaxID=470 RepID=UPI00244BFA8C|nr:hypothetical protein [Acinetobacter baumannii]MDH2645593.1 hypothetical protein [Acinetobacter baumannii]MDV7428477.1 hypothetical protein [Acinetobacter baumannii]
MFENLNLVFNKPEAFAQVLAAFIGVSGLAFTFIITFFKTKAFQKSEKIAEARLSIYLDLVEKYTAYAAFLYINIRTLGSEATNNKKTDCFLNFLTSCNKAYMVCSSKTKDELDMGFTFIYSLNSKIDEYGLEEHEKLSLIHQIEKKAMQLSLLMREEIGVLEDRELEKNIIERNFGK